MRQRSSLLLQLQAGGAIGRCPHIACTLQTLLLAMQCNFLLLWWPTKALLERLIIITAPIAWQPSPSTWTSVRSQGGLFLVKAAASAQVLATLQLHSILQAAACCMARLAAYNRTACSSSQSCAQVDCRPRALHQSV